MTLKEMEELRRYLKEAETSITEEDTMTHEDEEFYVDDEYVELSKLAPSEEISMTHEEMMDRLMAEYWRRIEEEENKKKEEIAMMTHEEMMNRAWQFIEGLNWLITDDEAEFQEDPTHLVLVDDIYKVRDAYYDDLENGYEDEEEDIYGFLDRHNIEWQ